MARVIALEAGHDGSDYRGQGEEFEVPDSRLDKDGKPADGSTWFVAVGKAGRGKEPAKANARPPGAGPLPGTRAKAE